MNIKEISKIGVAVAALLCVFISPLKAATVVYSGNLANETALPYSTTFYLNLNDRKIDQISFQLVWSTATLASKTWTDGTKSTGSVKVTSSPVAGIPGAAVCINATCLFSGVDWNWDTAGKSTATATSIMNAINGNSTLSAIVVSTTGLNSSIVYTTSTVNGTDTNYAMFSSTQAALTLSAPVTTSNGTGTSAMTGGTNAGWSLNGTAITIANHSFSNGLGVLLSTAAGGAMLPLVNQTTYYASVIDANTISLSTTQARAIAGQYVTFTSSSAQVTAHTFTLAPLAYTGTASSKWQLSNDGTNWVDSATGVQTFTAVYPSTSTYVDFGTINAEYMRLNVTGPTTGGLNLKVSANGKNSTTK